jgi:glycosyltransferase involved in cell wall biosynthesis
MSLANSPIPVRRVLIISHDIVAASMAGPGIRYYYMALALSREFEVTLAIPNPADPNLNAKGLRLVAYQEKSWATLEPLIQQCDAFMLNGYVVFLYPELLDVDRPVIIDGYDPLLAEWLAATRDQPDEQRQWWPEKIRQLTTQYLVGDFFICASERQRDWWLGLLENSGRINYWTVRDDPALQKLVAVVPYGLRSDPPVHTRSVIRNVWPGIGADDRIILWGGGLWLWLDPMAAVRALAKVWEHRQDVRLVFPGTRRPMVGEMHPPSHNEAIRQEAERLGLLNRAIFLGDWVEYQDWGNVLLESDIGLSLNPQEFLEAHLAYRTRVLEYIWAGLPMLVTSGDSTSDLVQQHQLGKLVDTHDIDGIAAALLELLDAPRQSYQERFAAVRQTMTWEKVCEPLAEFCRAPHRAPDREILNARAGNPFHLPSLEVLQEENQALREENQRLGTLVQAYQQRRAVRLLDRLAGLRRR